MNTPHDPRWVLAGRTLLVGAVVVAAALAGGCGVLTAPPASAPAAPPSTVASPETTNPPASQTPASPPPPAATAPASEWLISSAGIGPYKIGDPFQVDLARYDGYACAWTNVDSAGHGGIRIGDDSFGWTWDPEATTPALRITRVETSATLGEEVLPVRTAEGIGVGSTRAEVMAAYPDAGPDETGWWDELLITRDGVPIAFAFGLLYVNTPPALSDKVGTVVVGATTPVYEVCA